MTGESSEASLLIDALRHRYPELGEDEIRSLGLAVVAHSMDNHQGILDEIGIGQGESLAAEVADFLGEQGLDS